MLVARLGVVFGRDRVQQAMEDCQGQWARKHLARLGLDFLHQLKVGTVKLDRVVARDEQKAAKRTDSTLLVGDQGMCTAVKLTTEALPHVVNSTHAPTLAQDVEASFQKLALAW